MISRKSSVQPRGRQVSELRKELGPHNQYVGCVPRRERAGVPRRPPCAGS